MRFLTLVVLGVLYSCKEPAPEFKKYSKDISYKYLQVGSEKNIAQKDILEMQLMVLNETGDTLHFVEDYHYFLEPSAHVLDSVFRRFHVQDSILLKVKRSLFNEYFKFYKVLQSNEGEVLLSLKLMNSYDKSDADEAKQNDISKRELDEQVALQKYLRNLPGILDTLDGVYRQILIKTDSTRIEFGSEVSIHYRGYFLNGYVFDDTQEKSVTPTFTFGREYQMIEGFQTALSGRKEGERVKIILPSRHAFGEEGSLAGIVPPYTAVIYDVNIIKVIN
ncbi:MAG: FKBP-type peptidyl-prolyl cis-trans isomerase [Vicingaceae bacterium]|jgi:FKBP-type peptidyl-prolyl cis-trans isomerase